VIRPRTFRIRVLGCRVNHAEQRELASVLRRRGLEEAPPGHPGDLEIIHTCSVTARAAAKSRQATRRARRASPDAIVLVTGCLVGTDPEIARSLAGGAGAAIGHDTPLPQAVDHWLGAHVPDTGVAEAATASPTGIRPLPLHVLPNEPASHVRAEVRIQDGCDAHCTFCIIPRTRPVLRSKSMATVLDEVEALVSLGHREVVLTGIFLGAYGHETALRRRQTHPDREPLAELLERVAQVPGLARLRLSSLEPGDVSDALLQAMVDHADTVVPHLHLPLQSGSDEILRRMNRQYRVADYLEMVDRVEQALTREGLAPAITTDVICGFPGETEADFDRTMAVARRVGFLHMHVFPYSPRAGTAAARWTGAAVPRAVAADRVRRLIDLECQDGLADAFRRMLIDTEVRVLIEQPDTNRPGHWLGRSDHYALMTVAGNYERGEIVRAIPQKIEDDVMTARACPVGHALPLISRR
jgi:threonylcarbamoyladenosine tRNA methylthiotransferase MtaB